MTRRISIVPIVAFVIGCAAAAQLQASVTASPSTVSVFPGQTSSPITLTITYTAGPSGAGGPRTGTVSASGLPSGATTNPSPITYQYDYAPTPATTTTSFTISVPLGTMPGSYRVALTDQSTNSGSTVITLVVNEPSFSASASPNPLTLSAGSSANVTVTTTTDPGFTGAISYSFSGFPSFISTGGTQIADQSTNFAPVTFTFSAAPGATPGTYNGTLTGTPRGGTPRSFPFTVVIRQPDISARFRQSLMTMCGGTSGGNFIELAPVNGYSGTPQLNFITVPPGFTITPARPVASSMPPPQSIPITISAGNSLTPGTYQITLNVSDSSAGVSRNADLFVQIAPSDFTPAVTPSTINLSAGGAPQGVSASIAPNSCFNSPVSITTAGAPSGLTITPASASIAPPYAPASFSVQAASGLAPGNYAVTFTFTPENGAAKSVVLQVNVAATPDFSLLVTPSQISAAPGESRTVNVSATAMNGFSGSINVTAPSVPGVTFVPASFTLIPGGSQLVTVALSSSLNPQTITSLFSATAAGVSGTRTAPLTITVTAAADFALTATPPALSLPAGGSGTIVVSASGSGGFNQTVNVVAPAVAGVTLSPASFSLAPGTSQTVAVSVAPNTAPGTIALEFTATAAGVTGARTATVMLTMTAPPDFILSVSPQTLTIPAGSSGSVIVSVTGLNGFTQAVSVATPTVAGVIFSPATFTLLPGASQSVTITVAPNATPTTNELTFTGTSPSIAGIRTAPLALTIGARPDFSLAVTPAALTLRPSETATVIVSVTGVNGFTGPVTVNVVAPPDVTIAPATFVLTAGTSQSVTVSVGAVPATATPLPITFSGAAVGIGTRSAQLLLSLAAPLPSITAIAPPAVTSGVKSAVVRLTGQNFVIGASVLVPSSDVRIERVAVISPTLADVTLSVRDDAAAGPRTLRLRNPDGATTATGATLLIYPSSSLAGPLGITAAAIVFPAEGSIIAGREAVYPRALLATTGVGTIVGSWHFDGVPFDRFITTVSGGFPAEVRAHVPIPISFAGSHRLELVIETPQRAVSPLVNVVQAIDSASRLTALAPRDGSVITGRSRFRWSLVPSTSGYLLELRRAAAPNAAARPVAYPGTIPIRLSQSEWRPTREQLEALGHGIHSWRVRAIFPGETPGEPTAWQRFVVTPERVALTLLQSEGGAVRWSGGVPGLLYRVEFVAPDGEVAFSGLTSRESYRLPAGVPPLPAGYTIRVTALGPGGAVLGTSASSPVGKLRGVRLPQFVLVADLQVTRKEPPNGATVRSAQPAIEARWSGSVTPEEVSLMVDETDVTAVTTITPSSLTYPSLLPLSVGEHTVRLGLRGTVTTWTFKVAEGSEEAVAAGQAEKEEKTSAVTRDWVITPVGTLTAVDEAVPATPDPREARVQISTQSDIANPAVQAKVTGDLSFKHQIHDPSRTIQESRNWLTQFGATQGRFGQQVIVGYAGPDFLDQSEFVTAGLARGGVEGKLIFPFGTTAYYESFSTRPAGVVAGNIGPEQKVRAFAFQVPTSAKWDFRLIALDVNDEPGFNSAGGKGRAFGIFGKYNWRPSLNLLVEAARGGFDPRPESAQRNRHGNGFRFGFTGSVGTFSYTATLRKTDGEFVNPANRGFTPGGVPDRTGGTLSLTKVFGRTSVTANVRRLQDGTSSGALLPKTSETGGDLTLTTMLGQHVAVSLSGNTTGTRGSALPQLFLPRSDRTQTGWSGTLSETFGRFHFAQAVTLQRLRDAVSPISNQKIASATISAAGTITTSINLSAVASATRSEGAAAVTGTTNQRLVSLQPTFTIPRTHLSFQPRATWSFAENDLSRAENEAEMYQGLVTWAPPWLRSLASFQLSADWNKNRFTGQLADPKFVRRVAATFSLRTSAGRGAAAAAASVLPGTAPVEPPTGSTPVTNQQK